jgi:hypothetical protein
MEIQPYTESTPESLTATLRNWLIGCYIVEYEQRGSNAQIAPRKDLCDAVA